MTSREAFLRLWAELSGRRTEGAEDAYELLLTHYGQPQRRYHTIDHVGHCLQAVELVKGLLPDVGALAMAIWFHDVVFEAGARDNEVRSAALFRRLVAPQLDPAAAAAVERLILVTQAGRRPAQQDEAFMVDVDLSSFGRPWEAFLADSFAVRSERPGLSDRQFADGQAQFLKALLARDSLYHTEPFRSRYEAGARANITRYLEMISDPCWQF